MLHFYGCWLLCINSIDIYKWDKINNSVNDNFIMQSRLLTFFLVFAEILVSQTVPVPENEYDYDIDPGAVNVQFIDPRTCILPEPLQYGKYVIVVIGLLIHF